MREQLTEHFYRDEFACRCGCGFDTVDARLAQGLELLRAICRGPVHVNSGCRCGAHNAASGGSPKSQHLRGKAADVVVAGYSPAELARVAASLAPFANGGIGVYKNFTHLDVRDGKSRWDLS